jgi:hypothetical protein
MKKYAACTSETSATFFIDQSTPYHPILSKIHFNTIHPPMSWSS